MGGGAIKGEGGERRVEGHKRKGTEGWVKGEQPGIVGPAAVAATCVALPSFSVRRDGKMLHLDFPEGFSSAQSAAPDKNNNTWPVSRRPTRKVARCTRAGCQPAASAHTWNAIYLSFASSNSRTCRVCRARGTAERCILERASFATAERCILVRASCATSLDQQQLPPISTPGTREKRWSCTRGRTLTLDCAGVLAETSTWLQRDLPPSILLPSEDPPSRQHGGARSFWE